jgi:hypothetical protein
MVSKSIDGVLAGNWQEFLPGLNFSYPSRTSGVTAVGWGA